MNYIKYSFKSEDPALREILVATLSEMDFEGFEEDGAFLHAYVPEEVADPAAAEALAAQHGLSVERELIAPQNWNAQWESDFTPVILPGFCTVRASFHNIPVTTPYEVVITPKMSFGTGHHDTTQLVIGQMQGLDFAGKRVLDFGTGTGILAILSAMLGAGQVHGIDYDTWSYENALENVTVNGCPNIRLSLGSLEAADDGPYDVILANINRHILLEYMGGLYNLLTPGGTILMSGILAGDAGIIRDSALKTGFREVSVAQSNNWLALGFTR